MRETIINTLAQTLSNNIDQKLTNELATGIATIVNQAALAAEQAQATDEPTDPQESNP